MSDDVNYSDFVAWKKDPVTKLIFKDLEAARDTCLERMTSTENLDNPNGLLYLNRLRGYIDAINEITQLDLKELLTEEEDNNEEVYTSRVQNFGEDQKNNNSVGDNTDSYWGTSVY